MTRPSLSKPLASELKKSSGISIHGDRLRMQFSYKGVNCRETLPGVKISVEGVRFIRRKREAILYEITLGTFNYRTHFPESKRADIFGPPKAKIITVREAVDTWLAIKMVKKAGSTYTSYKKKSNKLVAKFGSRPLTSIDKTEMEAYQAELISDGALDPKYVNDIFTTIRGVWHDAYINGIIDRDFMDLIENFDVSEKESEADPFTQEELKRIAETDTVMQSELNMTMFNCWVGLSASELIGLAWEDIDMVRWTAKIRRSYVEGAYKVPKEKYRARIVEILHPARVYLLRQLEISSMLQPTKIEVKQRDNITLAPETIRTLFVNSKTNKHWSSPDNFSARFLHYHLRKAKVAYRPINQTKHTFASQMLTNYISKDWIISQLGHRDYSMLLKHYGKFIPDDTPLLADIVGQQLGLNIDELNAEIAHQKPTGKFKVVK
jgi:integrase